MEKQIKKVDKGKKYEGIDHFEKHKVNPFVEKVITKVQSVTIRKAKKIGADKSAQHLIVNQDTGEFEGYAQFMRIVEVDEEKFAKMYISQFAAFYELNKAGIKVLHYIISMIKPNQDIFVFNFNRCKEFTNYTRYSIYAALGNLIKNEIIARGPEKNEYFINPLIVFNGDRIAYTKAYIKKKKEKDKENTDISVETTLLMD